MLRVSAEPPPGPPMPGLNVLLAEVAAGVDGVLAGAGELEQPLTTRLKAANVMANTDPIRTE